MKPTANPDLQATDVALPPPGTYRIDPQASSITFTTRHMFGLGGVTGSFRFASGEITISEPELFWTASAAVHADSFKTNNAKRDKDVKSPRFLHAHAHPEISFRSTELARDGAQRVLRGEITVRDNNAPVELAIVSLSGDETGLTGRATTRIDRYAHGITKAKGIAVATSTSTSPSTPHERDRKSALRIKCGRMRAGLRPPRDQLRRCLLGLRPTPPRGTARARRSRRLRHRPHAPPRPDETLERGRRDCGQRLRLGHFMDKVTAL